MEEKPLDETADTKVKLLPEAQDTNAQLSVSAKPRNMTADWRRKVGKKFYLDKPLVREGIAEFLGTAVLIILGDGVVAQCVLSRNVAGAFLTINLGWALAVMLAICISGGVSGGHINPAMSVVFFALGDINIIQLVVYVLCQLVGAIFGAAVVFAVYFDALQAYDGGVRQVVGPNSTAGIFATYPQDFLSTGGGFVDQIVGTAILSSCVLAITDPSNMSIPKNLVPLLVGLTVAAVGMCYGYNCGYAINPARDLGPRIFTACAGWGAQVFSIRNYNWFWVPILGPILGALVGAGLYKVAVGNHWPGKYASNEDLQEKPPLAGHKLEKM